MRADFACDASVGRADDGAGGRTDGHSGSSGDVAVNSNTCAHGSPNVGCSPDDANPSPAGNPDTAADPYGGAQADAATGDAAAPAIGDAETGGDEHAGD